MFGMRHFPVFAVLLAAILLGMSGGVRAQEGENTFPVPTGLLLAADEDGLFTLTPDGATKTYLIEENSPNCWLRDGKWNPDGTQVVYTDI